MREMPDRETEFASSCSVGVPPVSNHAVQVQFLPFQKSGEKAHCDFGIPSCREDLVESISVLIHDPLQPVRLAMNHDSHLIQMRDIARSGLLVLLGAGIGRSEL